MSQGLTVAKSQQRATLQRRGVRLGPQEFAAIEEILGGKDCELVVEVNDEKYATLQDAAAGVGDGPVTMLRLYPVGLPSAGQPWPIFSAAMSGPGDTAARLDVSGRDLDRLLGIATRIELLLDRTVEPRRQRLASLASGALPLQLVLIGWAPAWWFTGHTTMAMWSAALLLACGLVGLAARQALEMRHFGYLTLETRSPRRAWWLFHPPRLLVDWLSVVGGAAGLAPVLGWLWKHLH